MPLSVLVVDDDARFRGLAARMLTFQGMIVIGQVGTVTEAIQVAGALRPDAVLVDIGLPDGDGFSLARHLSALSWRPTVVLISSDSDVANRAEAYRMGADGFVPKDELASDTLRDLIGG